MPAVAVGAPVLEGDESVRFTVEGDEGENWEHIWDVDRECGHVESCLLGFAIPRRALCAPCRVHIRSHFAGRATEPLPSHCRV